VVGRSRTRRLAFCAVLVLAGHTWGEEASRPTEGGRKRALPPGTETAFILPTSDRDQHGNPVITCNGSRFSPSTGWPYELWLNEPRMEFVFVHAGEFMMGEGSEQHRVRLTKPFYLAKYEITQVVWEKVMGARPWRGLLFVKDGVKENPRHPAVYISWQDCQEFMEKLNAATGSGLRLPTEAEWEYGCRAGTTTAYCSGDDEGGLKTCARYRGNTRDAGDQYAHEVGRKRPNEWGLYDMHGNVSEWCQDWYGEYGSGTHTNPQGAERGSYRLIRGGDFTSRADDCRSRFRSWSSPGYKNRTAGARLVRPLP